MNTSISDSDFDNLLNDTLPAFDDDLAPAASREAAWAAADPMIPIVA